MGDAQTVLADQNRMSGNSLRILMVEDSAEDAELERRHLRKRGLRYSSGALLAARKCRKRSRTTGT